MIFIKISKLSSEIAKNNPEEVLNFMQNFEQNEREYRM